MKIAIGTDHRGVEYKKDLMKKLEDEFELIDGSPVNHDTDDYPDFAFAVAKMVNTNTVDFGVLICGTGIGMSIAANKVKGIRCALVSDVETARLAKNHNDANVLAFSSHMSTDDAAECIRAFAKTSLNEDEKHARRVKKIIAYENGEYNEL